MSNIDNGGEAASQPTGGPLSVNIVAQYVKDLSFENPRAPMSLQARQNSPPINIGVNVGARQLGQTDYEVTLTLEAKAGGGQEVLFAIELAYCGIFRIANLPQEHLQPFLMIECARLLFPFARRIVADAVRDGGFPPLMIDPIDFVSLYQNRQAQPANPN
jgi:preprotein translocase subunit SecB